MTDWIIRYVLRPLAYLLAAFCFLSALIALLSGAFYGGSTLVLLGLACLPPSWDRLSNLLGRTIPINARLVTAFILFIIFSVAAMADEERVASREAARAEAERQSAFEAARDSLYGRISELSSEGQYEKIVTITTEWSDRSDDSLEALKLEAEAVLKAKRDSTREVELVEKVRGIPARNTTENLQVYEELASLDPDNDQYQARLDHYREQAEVEAQQQREEEAARVRQRALAAKWSYSARTDDMTGRTTHTATIRSENTVSFDFPYQGPQRGSLTMRNHPSYGRDVIFRIEKGQILCRSYSRCRVRVRFDEGNPIGWGANPAADQSTTVIFLQSYGRFVSLLQRSDMIRIQPEIYQEGSPVFEFKVGGFDPSRYAGS